MLGILLLDGAFLTAWSLFHSLGASFAAKRWARRRLGRWFLLYRLLYVALSTLSLAALWLWLPRPEGIVYRVVAPWSYGLRFMQVAGAIFFVAALRQFKGMEFLGIRQLGRLGAPDEWEEQIELNRSGPYGIVRHPLYTSSIVVMACEPTMSVWQLALTVWVTGYFLVGAVFEERRMAAILGAEYRRYRQRVPMFVPRARRSTAPRASHRAAEEPE